MRINTKYSRRIFKIVRNDEDIQIAMSPSISGA
jgi:hypothetical protein